MPFPFLPFLLHEPSFQAGWDSREPELQDLRAANDELTRQLAVLTDQVSAMKRSALGVTSDGCIASHRI